MKQVSYCLFETLLGWCGIAWSGGQNAGTPYSVALFQLPEATKELTESRIALNSGASEASESPSQIKNIICRVLRHLQGEVQDFRERHGGLGRGRFVHAKGLQGRPQYPPRKNCHLRRTCRRRRSTQCHPSRWTRSRQKPNPPYHPLPPSPCRPRKAGRFLRSRGPSDQGEAASHRRRRGQSVSGFK